MPIETGPQGQSGTHEHASAEANLWESRLLALNALVELARQHAVEQPAPGGDGYRLEHALCEVRQALGDAVTENRETLDAAVTAFGEALASLNARVEHRQ